MASSESPTTAGRRPLILDFVVLVAAGMLCYAHTLDVPWYLDDNHAIVENPVVQHLRDAMGEVLRPRGLTNLTFALNVALSGYSLAPFHLTNIAIHLLAGCVTLVLLRRVLPERVDIALLGALIFVVHPVQTQAVTYVVQRSSSLAGLLCLISTWLYLVARDDRAPQRSASGSRAMGKSGGVAPGSRRTETGTGEKSRSSPALVPYLGSLGIGGAAMLAKENAAALPLLLALCELCIPPRPTSKRLPWRRLAWVLPYLLIPGIFAIRILAPVLDPDGPSLASVPGIEGDVVANAGEASPLNYLATETLVVWRYLRLAILPIGQVFDLGRTIGPEPFRPAVLLASAGLIALLAGAFMLRRRARLVTFGTYWFFLALSIESTLIPLDPYFEHRLYLPMFGFVVVAVTLLDRWIAGRRLLLGCGLILVAALALLTIRRNQQWRDPAVLWAADLEHGSTSYRSAVGLADALFARGDQEGARRAYLSFSERAAARCREEPCGATYVLNLGVAAERLGDKEAAAQFYRQAIAIDARYGRAHYNLGVLLFHFGKYEESRAAFSEAVRLEPGDADARFNLGIAALTLGDEAAAADQLGPLDRLAPERATELRVEIERHAASSRR